MTAIQRSTLEQHVDPTSEGVDASPAEYDAVLVRCSAVKPPIDVMVLYTTTGGEKTSVALCVHRNPDNSCDLRKYTVHHKTYHYPCELTRE